VVEIVEDWAAARPAAALRPFVDGYAGYRQAGLPPARHRGLPSPSMTMIITLDEQLHIAEHPDAAQAPQWYDTLVGGLHTRPALITHEGAQSGLQLSLSPLGARALLGVPAGELASLDLHGQEVLGEFALHVQDRVRTATSWGERFALLDELLGARLAEAGSPAVASRVRPDVEYAWGRIVSSGGDIAVHALAREVACSPRHLGELFDREIGLSPKEACRVVRFDRARRRLQRGWSGSLADLAAGCGYYDQPHLNRDFRRMAGAAPLAWLAEELRNVQVPPAGMLASSSA
jgi:AraC-like DNA-binding protein